MKTFEDFSEAFDFCREKDQPVAVVVLDEKYEPGEYKLYPSGIAKLLCSYAGVKETEKILRAIVEAEHRILEAAYSSDTVAEMEANEESRRAIQAAVHHVDALDEERA